MPYALLLPFSLSPSRILPRLSSGMIWGNLGAGGAEGGNGNQVTHLTPGEGQQMKASGRDMRTTHLSDPV